MRTYLLMLFLTVLSAASVAQNCPDIADESHHQLLYSNSEVRVFLLELPRLAATDAHCHSHPYFYVVAGEGRTSTTPEGQVTFSHDWRGGETRFILLPAKHTTRNEGINLYREVVVESLRPIQYHPLDGNYDSDELAGDPGSTRPTWTLTTARGPLSVSKTQLAPGADYVPQAPHTVLIALTDLQLKRDREGLPAQSVDMNAQDVQVFSGETARITNTGSHTGRFITVEF